VPPGFHVDLVASEPDIINPIAMSFDDRGRIWVTESVEYPRKSAGAGRDRVKVIEDTDGGGRADKITVFADGLNIPTGVALGYGGAWVLNAPDLLFMREKDGKATSREVVLTGFGRTDTHELPNSLTWGPDGWLYGLNGVFNRSSIISHNGKRYDFTCAMWRIHPRTREFQVFAEGTSNPYGLGWDTEGSAMIEACHWANDHLFHFVETGCYQRQAGAYPPFAMKIGSITDHGHQKTAYCGLAFLDTDAFPPQYRGRICVGNIHGGCINVDRLQRNGATYLAKAEPDLLTANDAWFMPVSLKVGPDGSLYILDWYDRYHCSQDAARDPDGVDRLKGRLYRLRYGDKPRTPSFDLATESDDHLVAQLSSGNIFFRESAQRILTERMGGRNFTRAGSTKLRATLEKLTFDKDASRKARLHALWTLIGSGSLTTPFHQRLLAHEDATFRAWGVRAAGNLGRGTKTLRERVAALARDPSPDVQLQVAITARKIDGLDPLPVLINVLAHCGQDKLVPAIVWPNLHPLLETDSARFVSLLKRETSSPSAVAALMPRMIERILSGPNTKAAAAAELLELTLQSAPDRASECIAAVSASLSGLNATQLAELKQRLRPVLEQVLSEPRSTALLLSAQLLAVRIGVASVDASGVRQKFLSAAEPETTRLQALEALIAFRDETLLDSLPDVLASGSAQFASHVFAVLGRFDHPKLADVILRQYSKLPPEIQPLAIDLLMQREPWARKLLDAVLEKKLSQSVLNANHLRKILESNDREALWAVEKAFGKVREERNPEREKVVVEMGEYLRKNIGDPFAGQRVFRNLCAQCHTIYGEGGKVGPDLTANGRASFDQVVSSVFDPSLVIGPGYQTVTVVMTDGRNLTGLVTEDSEQRVLLKMPGEGEESVPRNRIQYERVSKLSMMPEGIESLLDKKDLSDLFAFLSLDKPPADSTAKPIPGAPAVTNTLLVQVARTAKEDHEALKKLLGIAALRPGRNGSNPQATNYANYDESKANPFPKLPDPLVMKNGTKVTTPAQWWEQRRPEIVEDFDREIYARVPTNTPAVKWEVTKTTRETNGSIPVITKQLMGHVDNSSYPLTTVNIQASLSTPAGATAPVPVMLQFGFLAGFGGLSGANRPGGSNRFAGPFGGTNWTSWQQQVLAKGWGYAIISPNSIQADNGSGLTQGIIGLCNKGRPRKVDDWGALRAWAWGASRLLDYFETDKSVNATQVGIEGHSRYGKATLVAMAYDPRFVIAYVSSSGAGGAKLHRRDWGEIVENVAGSGEYHWMAGNYLKYAGPLTWDDLPVDSHELIALCAPRPVFLSAGAATKGDGWVDAKGTFLAGVGAGPVYELLGKKAMSTTEFPAIETFVDGDVAFRQHNGGHTDAPNWPAFLSFASRYINASHALGGTSSASP